MPTSKIGEKSHIYNKGEKDAFQKLQQLKYYRGIRKIQSEKQTWQVKTAFTEILTFYTQTKMTTIREKFM